MQEKNYSHKMCSGIMWTMDKIQQDVQGRKGHKIRCVAKIKRDSII